MKETLILITSNFPFGKGETFLETELPYLSESFSKLIIIPSKPGDTLKHRNIPDNCTVDSYLRLKKNKEGSFLRFFTKLFIALSSPFFYKELVRLLPNRIDSSVLNELFTYTLDAVWTKRKLTKDLKSHSSDLSSILIYTYWCSGVTLGATLVNPKLSVISRAHRTDLYEELYSKNFIPFRKTTFSGLRALYSISKNGVSYLSEKYPEQASRFKLSRLGIPIPENSETDQKNTDGFIVVSCSSINSNKRVDKIRALLEKTALKYPSKKITWHHFGSGPLMSELQNLINKFPKNLHGILHGHIDNKTLINWYKKHEVHLFINLSKSEGIPVSIMEACSFGIPALATNVGGTSELVSNENGWLIDNNNVDSETLHAMEEAISHEDLRRRKGEEARRICSSFFNSDINYPGFIDMIKSTV